MKRFLPFLFLAIFIGSCSKDIPITKVEFRLTSKTSSRFHNTTIRNLYQYNLKKQLEQVEEQTLNNDGEFVTYKSHSIFYNDAGQMIKVSSNDGHYSEIYYTNEKIDSAIHYPINGGKPSISRFIYKKDKLIQVNFSGSIAHIEWNKENISKINWGGPWSTRSVEFMYHDSSYNWKKFDLYRVFTKNCKPEDLYGLSANNALCSNLNQIPESKANFCMYSYNKHNYPTKLSGRTKYLPFETNLTWGKN